MTGFIAIAVLLGVTSLGNTLLSMVFNNAELLTNAFAAIVIILVFFNWVLATKNPVQYRPVGNAASLHEIFGPLGEIFNFGFFGFLVYEIFLTAITVLAISYRGSLSTIVPSEPLYVLGIMMLLLLGFCGYIIYSMLYAIWFSPVWQKKGKIVPSKAKQFKESKSK